MKAVAWLYRAARGLALPLVCLGAVALGCAQKTAEPPAEPPDGRAQLVIINADRTVNPPHVTLKISSGDRIQWQNKGSEPVTVTIKGSPIGTLVRPNQLSRPYRVNPDVTGTYPYSVRPLPAGETAWFPRLRPFTGVAFAQDSLPPDEPDITVEP